MKEKLLPDLHPLKKTKSAITLLTPRINKKEQSRKIPQLDNMGIHKNKLKKKNKTGLNFMKNSFINLKVDSLVTSFKPSLKGCKRPKGPTIVGPLRTWIYLKNFRSNKV
jgi:hypothetical protein